MMMLITRLRVSLIVLGCLMALGSKVVQASPFIEANDTFLRESINVLNDAGVIHSNVTSYPLPWYSIAQELRDVDISNLSELERFAFYRVQAALQFAQQPNYRIVQLRAANDNSLSSQTTVNHRERAALSTGRSFTGDYLAGRVMVNWQTDSVDDKRYSFVGSYLATSVGNWALGIDQLHAHWGPGRRNALVLSDNAIPVQALRATRMLNEPIPYLSALGRVGATAFFGRTQRAGSLGDHPVMGARVSVTPIVGLEIGAGFTGQVGGRGFEAESSDYIDVITLQSADTIGNQRAGLDVRLALMPLVQVYGEYAANIDDSSLIAYTIGADYRIPGNRLATIFAEYSDIDAYFYDDMRDPSGYRRHGLSAGASDDQDASALTLGYSTTDEFGRSLTVQVRHIEFGQSNRFILRDYSAPLTSDITRRQVDVTYQRALGNGLLSIGAEYFNDSSKATDIEVEDGFNLYTSWELRF